MKTIFGQRERVNQPPTRSGWSGRRVGVGGHTTANCRLPALFFCVISLLPGCATRRYVREQIAINNCVQTLRAIERENGVLYAAVEMYAERPGPQRSEIGRVAHDLTVYDMCERLNKLEETTRKIREVAE
jgi:hypothetical protein